MLAWVTSSIVLATISVDSTALGCSGKHQVEDAAVLIQRAVSERPASGACREGVVAFPQFQDADKLKRALEGSTAVIKMAASLLPSHTRQAAKAHRQSRDAKSREGVTRSAIREHVRALLKGFPGLSSSTRGVLTGWAVPQLMELRRNSGQAIQDLIDNIAALDMIGTTADNVDSKLPELAGAFRQSGYEDIARNVTAAAPYIKMIVHGAKLMSSAVAEKASTATVLRTAANLSTVFHVHQPVTTFLSEASVMFDEHPKDLYRLLHSRAVQLFNEMNINIDSRVSPALSGMIVALAPKAIHGDLHFADIMPWVSRLLGDLGVGQSVKSLPVVLSFLSDLFKMNQALNHGNVDRGQVLMRVATFLRDLNVFDSVGGPLAAFAGLMGDLAKISEGQNVGLKDIVPRFAQLADELHVFNYTTRKGMAAVFSHVATFTCQLSGMRHRLRICGGPERSGASEANSSAATLSLLATTGARLGGADGEDGADRPSRRERGSEHREIAGQVMGTLLLSSAVRGHGGSIAFLQQGARAYTASDPCGAPAPMLGKSATAVEAISHLLSADHKSNPKRKRTQSAEAKHREPITRAALREQIVALLGHFPAIPSMARSVITGKIVPKIMELRRNSEPRVQKAIDTAAAIDVAAVSQLVRDLSKVASEDNHRMLEDPTHAASLLRHAVHIVQKSKLNPQLAEFMLDLAKHLDLGVHDWTHVIRSQAPLLLSRLKSRGVSGLPSNITDDLLTLYNSRDAAAIVSGAAQLLNKLGGVRYASQENVAVAVEAAAQFMCSLKGMRRHLPLCATFGTASAVPGEDEEEERQQAAELVTALSLKPRRPQAIVHR